MSTNYSPKIVTDGLVLCLDAANPKSYPGSGSTWFDLSGNGKHAVFVGSPQFNPLERSFSFPNVSDYMEVPNAYETPSVPVGSDSRTIIAFCLTGPSSYGGVSYAHALHYGTDSTSQSYGIAIRRPDQVDYPVLANHTWGTGSSMEGLAIEDNEPYFFATTYDDTRSPRNQYCVNGYFGPTGYVRNTTGDYSINTSNAKTLKIGTRVEPVIQFGPEEPWTGEIFSVMIYNRLLSNEEILRNFYAIRSRYSITVAEKQELTKLQGG